MFDLPVIIENNFSHPFYVKVTFNQAQNMCDAQGGMVPISIDTPSKEDALRSFIASNGKRSHYLTIIA
jgi:hypothetical protein